MQPLVAARAVLVARASAQAGAIMAGAWAGLLAYVAPRSGDLAAAADDTAAAALGVVGALMLVGGGLWLQHCCRTPDDPADGPDERPTGGGGSELSGAAGGPERHIRGPLCTDSRDDSGGSRARRWGLARTGRCGSRATVGLRP